MNRLYGLSEYNFHFYIDRGQKQYSQNIDSQARQKIATNVWRATEKVLYSSGQIIRFHKERNLNSISGKSNATGIRYRNEHLLWNGLDIPVRIRRMTAMQGNALNMISATAVLLEDGINISTDTISRLCSRAFHHRSM